MSLAGIAERLTAKRWTPEIAEAYIGPFERTCLAHAAEPDVRERAASGGAVSALLISQLASGQCDGALVCATTVRDGRVRAEYRIATTPQEILDARGSTYVLGDFVGEALPLIQAFEGRVAVVALPCEITALSKRPELAAKTTLRIALFCGHATTTALIDRVVERFTEGSNAELVGFRFREGHWRGMMRAQFADGSVIERPFGEFGTYQNLYVCSAKKCLFCGDHFGYDADLCAGDIWSAAYKSDPIKHTAVIAKTPVGTAALKAAQESTTLEATDVSVATILDGQRRVAPFHYNTTARARAAVRWDMKIPAREGVQAAWHERMAAGMALRNHHASLTEEGLERLMRRSPLSLKLELLVLKGLESLS